MNNLVAEIALASKVEILVAGATAVVTVIGVVAATRVVVATGGVAVTVAAVADARLVFLALTAVFRVVTTGAILACQ